MKWLKHDSFANADAKLRRLKMRHGVAGYGTYWHILEKIAQNIEPHNLSFELEDDADLIAIDTHQEVETVEEMLNTMVELGLFKRSNKGKVTCPRMVSRTDEYIGKLLRKTTSNSQVQESPDGVRRKSEKVPPIRTEQNRREKNRSTRASSIEEDLSDRTWAKKKGKEGG